MNILFVEPQDDRFDLIRLKLEGAFGCTVEQIPGFKDAVSRLLDENSVHLIICDDSDENEKLFKYVLSVENRIPFVVIKKSDEDRLQAFPELKLIGTVDQKDLAESLEQAVGYAIKKGMIPNKKGDCDYTRVAPRVLARIVPLEADIYIRLSNVKFVKLYNKGDTFGPEDLTKIVERKKISRLYIQKDDLPVFLEKFNALADKIADDEEITEDKIPGISQEIHETILELSEHLGFNEAVQGLVKNNVKTVVKSMKNAPGLAELLKRLDKVNYVSSHSTMVAHVACGLAVNLTWNSDQTFEKLTYAAFLHDITVKSENIAVIGTAEELANRKMEFSDEMINTYLEHPNEAADIAEGFSELPADVGVIIREHHERPDGSGFPKQTAGIGISPISCLFIVAHDLVQSVYLKDQSIDDFLKEKTEFYKVGNFRKVIQALEDARAVDGKSEESEKKVA